MKGNNKKERELLGYKRKESKDKSEEIDCKKYLKKEIIFENKNFNLKEKNEEKIRQEEKEELNIKDLIIESSINKNNEDNKNYEITEDICEKCRQKKKILVFRNKLNIFNYFSNNNISLSFIKDLKEMDSNFIYKSNKKICSDCLNNLIKNKTSFESFINYDVKINEEKENKIEYKFNNNINNFNKDFDTHNNNIDIFDISQINKINKVENRNNIVYNIQKQDINDSKERNNYIDNILPKSIDIKNNNNNYNIDYFILNQSLNQDNFNNKNRNNVNKLNYLNNQGNINCNIKDFLNNSKSFLNNCPYNPCQMDSPEDLEKKKSMINQNINPIIRKDNLIFPFQTQKSISYSNLNFNLDEAHSSILNNNFLDCSSSMINYPYTNYNTFNKASFPNLFSLSNETLKKNNFFNFEKTSFSNYNEIINDDINNFNNIIGENNHDILINSNINNIEQNKNENNRGIRKLLEDLQKCINKQNEYYKEINQLANYFYDEAINIKNINELNRIIQKSNLNMFSSNQFGNLINHFPNYINRNNFFDFNLNQLPDLFQQNFNNIPANNNNLFYIRKNNEQNEQTKNNLNNNDKNNINLNKNTEKINNQKSIAKNYINDLNNNSYTTKQSINNNKSNNEQLFSRNYLGEINTINILEKNNISDKQLKSKENTLSNIDKNENN